MFPKLYENYYTKLYENYCISECEVSLLKNSGLFSEEKFLSASLQSTSHGHYTPCNCLFFATDNLENLLKFARSILVNDSYAVFRREREREGKKKKKWKKK